MKDISSNVASMSTTIGQAGLDPDAVGGKGGMSLDDLPAQMINLNIATRAYKANVAVLKRYEQMIETTLELLR
jgi:flagellar basal body rod protein FlgC